MDIITYPQLMTMIIAIQVIEHSRPDRVAILLFFMPFLSRQEATTIEALKTFFWR